MSITITLTEDEASALFDVLEHTSNDIGERLPDCEDDPDAKALWEPMFNISQRVMELIEATITENNIMGKPRACPQCGEDNDHDGIKKPYLLEMTGADAHCDHEGEYNYSCSSCGCRFDEVWAYSHKEVTRRGGEG